jgi:succinyl-CoA synthetase beta subunit
VAEGLADACRQMDSKVPLIVRAAGTNGDLARKILVGQGIPVDFADKIGRASCRERV